jgi:hypothetical protein
MRGYMDRTILAEVYPEIPSNTLKKVIQIFENMKKNNYQTAKEIEKEKESENYVLSLLRPKQIGRQLIQINSEKEKFVGKIFRREDYTDLESVTPYTDSDFDEFNRDLVENPFIFAKRILKSVKDGRNTIFPFLDNHYIDTINSLYVPFTPSGNILGVGIYARTYYFMTKFMYQLHDKPYIAIPFWTRDFTEPFEDTEELSVL